MDNERSSRCPTQQIWRRWARCVTPGRGAKRCVYLLTHRKQLPKANLVADLLLIPLDDIVVFPHMSPTLTVDVGDEERVFLVPRHVGEFATVGTVAEVVDQVRLPGGGHAVELMGLHRGLARAARTGLRGELRVEVEEHEDNVPVDGKTRDLEREYRAVVEEILEL